jgi:hypothetical protein
MSLSELMIIGSSWNEEMAIDAHRLLAINDVRHEVSAGGTRDDGDERDATSGGTLLRRQMVAWRS